MKKNQTFLLRLIFVSALVFFSACGDSDSGSTPVAQPCIMELTAETQDDLPNCTKKREGDSSYVSSENSVYLCINESWRYLGEVADNEDVLPNCTENRNGERAFLVDDHVTLLCSGNKWSPYDIYKGIEPEEVRISSSSSENSLLMDSRDGQTYKTVTIGSQTWMAENLNYETDSSFCYNNQDSNCTKYGRLYRWAKAVGKSDGECGYGNTCSLPSTNIQGVCPDGWHLPSKNEWEILFKVDGEKTTAGKVLKSTFGWDDGGNGSDALGFSALSAGYRRNDGRYVYEGKSVDFWSSTEGNSGFAYGMELCYNSDGARLSYDDKKFGFSVRCLKDDASAQTIKSSSSEIPKGCGDLWCGPTDSDGRVIIEEYSDNIASGWWFDYNDDIDGGNSEISFPSEIKEDKNGNFFGPLIDAYDGIKASVSFGDGYDYPFVGLGFTIVSADYEGADISSWKGICIVYQSSMEIEIHLNPVDERNMTAFNDYRVIVPSSMSMSNMDFSWANFEQESGWGRIVNISTVLANTATITLVFNGTAGENGEFFIQSIGRQGTCK